MPCRKQIVVWWKKMETNLWRVGECPCFVYVLFCFVSPFHCVDVYVEEVLREVVNK